MEKGNNIIVYKDGVAIAATRSNDIGHDCDVVEVASSINGTARNYIAGQTQWDVTVNFLVASTSAALASLLTVGTSYTIVIGATGQTSSTKHGLSGTAICRTCRITATKGNLVQGSFAFQGSGPLASV